jgi:uracil-DNA glycosylase family 4
MWDYLGTDVNVPIMWNAFPFHPHLNNSPESNRRPNEEELEVGEQYIKLVFELFKPKKLCSLGRVGESVLHRLFPNETITYIRHPSYGGKKDFILGMSKIL